MGHRVTRRSTLKAGAHVAWAVPVVSAATAAPAQAVSPGEPGLVMSSVGGEYGRTSQGTRSDWLAMSWLVTNNGTETVTDVVVTVTIPPGLYASAPNDIRHPDDWIALSTTQGSLGTGWQIQWMRPGPLGVGETVGDQIGTFLLQFTDPVTEPPYRSWAGESFTLGFTAQPAGGGTASTPATSVVGAAPPTYFSIPRDAGYHGTFSNAEVTLEGYAVNVGVQSSKDVTLRFWWGPSGSDDAAWHTKPLGATSPQLGTATITDAAGTDNDPWFITFPPHGPTATSRGFPSFEAAEPYANIPFTVVITLAAAPQDLASQDFYMDVRGEDCEDPNGDQFISFQSVLVTHVDPG